jgi:hypothetical protein
MRWRAACAQGRLMIRIALLLRGREGIQAVMSQNLTGRLTLLSLVLIRGAPALAGEHAAGDFPLHASALPSSFSLSQPPADPKFSATEFRPRKSSLPAADPANRTGPILDAPMLKDTSVWQQMAQYRSQDRVRLLTLWQARGSTLSLQAGRHGAPTLQWSTPWVNREGVSHGLLDRLFASPSRSAANTFRTPSARPATIPAVKPAEFPPGISAK